MAPGRVMIRVILVIGLTRTIILLTNLICERWAPVRSQTTDLEMNEHHSSSKIVCPYFLSFFFLTLSLPLPCVHWYVAYTPNEASPPPPDWLVPMLVDFICLFKSYRMLSTTVGPWTCVRLSDSKLSVFHIFRRTTHWVLAPRQRKREGRCGVAAHTLTRVCSLYI